MASPNHNNDNIHETLNQILQTQQAFIQNQNAFQQNQHSFQQDLVNLTTEVNQIRTRIPPPGFNLNTTDTQQNHGFTNTSIKLEIPRFNGSEVLSWIFKINQFFDFHHTAKEQRLRIASFYMEGEALIWYRWMHSNNQLLFWPMFLNALELRFAPSHFDDPRGALFKLCQTTTVKDYQTVFESLANRISGLPNHFFELLYFWP